MSKPSLRFGCLYKNCKREYFAKGFCKIHYKQKYRQEYKEKIRLKNKQYRIKHKLDNKEYHRKYYLLHKDDFGYKRKAKERYKNYYLKIKHIPDIQTKRKEISIRCRNKNLQSWIGIIPQKTKCQICGKEIYFNKNNKRRAIHFDHKNENILIKVSPMPWLTGHKKTSENQKIWESCNFGMLCEKCNAFLVTKNRKEWIKKLNNYVFDGE